tara:strand:- start:505 stop:630 length:126 start_codon:yes stop_codon:yes gene_type:complete
MNDNTRRTLEEYLKTLQRHYEKKTKKELVEELMYIARGKYE